MSSISSFTSFSIFSWVRTLAIFKPEFIECSVKLSGKIQDIENLDKHVSAFLQKSISYGIKLHVRIII